MENYIKKIVLHNCPNCNAKQDMVIISHESNLDIFWLRCKKCYQCIMIDGNKLKNKEILTTANLPAKENRLTPEEEIIKYEPKKKYRIGQKLYHKKFDDKGVVWKVISPQKILVRFDHLGEKKLVQGI